jgi:hypothetical protein
MGLVSSKLARPGAPHLAFEMGVQTLPTTSLPAESRIGRARLVAQGFSLGSPWVVSGPINAASALNLSASANGATYTSMGRSPMDRPPRNPRAEGSTYKPSRLPPPRLLHRAPSLSYPLPLTPDPLFSCQDPRSPKSPLTITKQTR